MMSMEQTYLALLLIPVHSTLRDKMQGEMALCRDALAAFNDETAEATQCRYESIARCMALLLDAAMTSTDGTK